MENYLPDEGFGEIQNVHLYDDWILIYRALNAEQKDFLNISKGLTNKKINETRTDLESGVQELYENISEEDFNKLDKGLKFGNFKSEFPKLFDSQNITKEFILARTQHQQKPNELQEILTKTSKLL